ncbi:MAG TPA: ATP-binding protein [Thermoplasmata archaeon]|nr:ATP-binding protein [Thermoplasmata archaeon]
MGAATPTSSSDPNGTIRLTIGSRLELLSMVHALIQGISRQYELDEETENALLIAVIEAGTNAIQHGNVFALEKTVTFDFTLGEKSVMVRVEDHGRGFDPSLVENPTDASNLLDPSGRGLFLMRSLMDDVSFDVRQDHGTTVRLTKTLPRPTR